LLQFNKSASARTGSASLAKNLHALAVGILKEKPQQNITNRYYKDTEL